MLFNVIRRYFFSTVLLLCSVLCAQSNSPAEGTVRSFQLPPEQVEQVVFNSSSYLQINVGISPTDFIRILQVPQDWRVERKGAVLMLSADSTSTTVAKIDLALPAKKNINVAIYAKEGSVNAQKGQRDLKINLISGKVQSIGSTGLLQVFLQKGDVVVQNHNGPVLIDGFTLQSQLKNVVGEGSLQQFQGAANIQNWQGHLNLNTHKSSVVLSESQGTLQVDTNEGLYNIQSYKGRIEGLSKAGQYNLNLNRGGVDLSLKSQNSKITVQSPSVAFLNINSSDGDILLPSPLRVLKTSTEKFYRGYKGTPGSIKNEEGPTRIIIRNNEGTTVIR